MSVSYFVRYRGVPRPAEPFLRYYRETHAPLLAAFPGIRSLVLHTPQPWRDAQPIGADDTDFMAQMCFDDATALAAALRSEARERARADFANLPKGDALVTHQAMMSERLF